MQSNKEEQAMLDGDMGEPRRWVWSRSSETSIMPTRFLDCSNEVSEIREPPAGRLVWLTDDLSESDIYMDCGIARQELRVMTV